MNGRFSCTDPKQWSPINEEIRALRMGPDKQLAAVGSASAGARKKGREIVRICHLTALVHTDFGAAGCSWTNYSLGGLIKLLQHSQAQNRKTRGDDRKHLRRANIYIRQTKGKRAVNG